MSNKYANRHKSYLNSLAEVFSEASLEYLSYRDYPEVKRFLGWEESLYKKILLFLGNDAGQLLARDFSIYMPTSDDIEGLKCAISSSFITVLALTGCKLEELWQMRLQSKTLIIYTRRGSIRRCYNLQETTEQEFEEFQYWVNVLSKNLSQEVVLKKWHQAERDGVVSIECTAESFILRYDMFMKEPVNLDAKLANRLAGIVPPHEFK